MNLLTYKKLIVIMDKTGFFFFNLLPVFAKSNCINAKFQNQMCSYLFFFSYNLLGIYPVCSTEC